MMDEFQNKSFDVGFKELPALYYLHGWAEILSI